MATNPFRNPIGITLGYIDASYFLNVSPRSGDDQIIHLGPLASTAALVMKANNVNHFDYHPSLFNNTDRTVEFMAGAAAVGYAV